MIVKEEGITTTKVASVLETSSRDVGTLCTHPNIKMWSRMKPVRIESCEPDRKVQWWKGDAGNCGIDATNASTNSVASIPSLYTEDKLNGYAYQRPKGGASLQPFRLADFGGYDSEALPPILDFVVTEEISKSPGILSAQYAPSTPDYDLNAPGSLTLGEIGGFQVDGHNANLGDLYFGVVIMQGDTVKKYQTSDKKGTSDFKFLVNDLPLGSYTAYPFLCSVYQDGKEEKAGKYYTLPNVACRQFKLIETNVNIEVDAAWYYKEGTYDKDYLTYEIYVTQDIATSFYLNNNSVRLRYASSPDSAPMAPYEYSNVIESVSVTQGHTKIASGRFNGPFNPKELYNLRVSIHGGTYKTTIIPREDFNPIH